jgi:hypothetical protein
MLRCCDLVFVYTTFVKKQLDDRQVVLSLSSQENDLMVVRLSSHYHREEMFFHILDILRNDKNN